jgi:NTP pyrophosphatase (non-canonical NTP hydrolase)
MAEKYLFKLIEEAIEVRKEFPSVMNPFAKNQKDPSLIRIQEELSDVFLFFINLLIVWDIDFEKFIDSTLVVQDINYKILNEKLQKSSSNN